MKAQALTRRFELPMLIASGLTIPCLVAEELGATGPSVLVLNYAIWTAFLIETVVMLAVVPNRWQWIRHHPLDNACPVPCCAQVRTAYDARHARHPRQGAAVDGRSVSSDSPYWQGQAADAKRSKTAFSALRHADCKRTTSRR
jgi:hypothetical protein